MLDDSAATIVPLQQTRRPKTAAERQRACRERKRLQRQTALAAVLPDPAEALPNQLPAGPAAALPVTMGITPAGPTGVLPVTVDVTPAGSAAALPPTASVTPAGPAWALPVTVGVTPADPAAALPATASVTPGTKSHCHVTDERRISAHGLTAAALALCGVALTTNGWFARSLGSTDLAGWLFLGVSVAADLVLLALPPTAAQLWQAGKRASAVAAWLIWLIASVFAFTGGIGFASSNIADVSLARVTHHARSDDSASCVR